MAGDDNSATQAYINRLYQVEAQAVRRLRLREHHKSWYLLRARQSKPTSLAEVARLARQANANFRAAQMVHRQAVAMRHATQEVCFG